MRIVSGVGIIVAVSQRLEVTVLNSGCFSIGNILISDVVLAVELQLFKAVLISSFRSSLDC